jgi:pimeloyl-ACP methyl ester carboxylesterase
MAYYPCSVQWRGECTPYEPGYGWYVSRARETIQSAAAEAEGRGVVVVGHSAGGWLGRAVVGDTEWLGSQGEASSVIRALVTLGAPHFPPRTDLFPDARDMTQGALAYTDKTFPGELMVVEPPSHMRTANKDQDWSSSRVGGWRQPCSRHNLFLWRPFPHFPLLFLLAGAHVKNYGIACVTVASGAIQGDSEAEQGTPVRIFSLSSSVCARHLVNL